MINTVLINVTYNTINPVLIPPPGAVNTIYASGIFGLVAHNSINVTKATYQVNLQDWNGTT
jgi:hypothetical protein